MAVSSFTTFAALFAVLMVVSFVTCEPQPEPEPEPGCARAIGASETKCGAVVVPTCVTIHHRAGTIRKCCPCGGYGHGYGHGYGYGHGHGYGW